jgi:DNA repair photolyase
MKSAPPSLPLPLLEHSVNQPQQDPLNLSHHSLPRVEKIPRKGTVLHPSPMVDQDDVFSLNLTKGCAHRCSFCSVRANPNYPGDEVVYLYADTAEQLDKELTERTKLPRAVYVSPSTDPFPPLAEIQTETSRVVAVLAHHGVETWLMTRGYIRPAALETLAAHHQHIKVTIGLTTLDRTLQRALEPLTASPRMRLRQIRRLRELGIGVQVALEPLLPGLTDTRENMASVLQALNKVGVSRVTAGYMFLRPRIRDNLSAALKEIGCGEELLAGYTNGPILHVGAIAPACYLPKARRQRGYAALMALAADLGIIVRVSALTNPDFRSGYPSTREARPYQPLLPAFREDPHRTSPFQGSGV